MKFLELLREYDVLGFKKLDNGTQLIGRTPHIGSHAWLHIIFAGVNNEQLNHYEDVNSFKFPFVFKKFLTIANGLDIFSGSLYFFGIRSDYDRSGNIWQPFDVNIPNLVERRPDFPTDSFIIGGYRAGDGYFLCLDKTRNTIYLSPKNRFRILYEWATIEGLLETEILRLSKLFDGTGRRISSAKKTVPL